MEQYPNREIIGSMGSILLAILEVPVPVNTKEEYVYKGTKQPGPGRWVPGTPGRSHKVDPT